MTYSLWYKYFEFMSKYMYIKALVLRGGNFNFLIKCWFGHFESSLHYNGPSLQYNILNSFQSICWCISKPWLLGVASSNFSSKCWFGTFESRLHLMALAFGINSLNSCQRICWCISKPRFSGMASLNFSSKCWSCLLKAGLHIGLQPLL